MMPQKNMHSTSLIQKFSKLKGLSTQKFSGEINQYLIDNIYKKFDLILSKIANQIAPIRGSFNRYEIESKEVESTSDVNWSWSIVIDNKYFYIPNGELLIDDDLKWYPVLLKTDDKGHMMLLIESDTNFFLFDPNSNLKFFEEVLPKSGINDKKLISIINYIINEIDKNKTKELVILKHISFNDTSDVSYDIGQCGPWCVLLLDFISTYDLDFQDSIDNISKLTFDERTKLIYSYCGYLYMTLS